MIFTEEQLRQCAGFFAELEAKSIGSFPSEFGVNTGNNELNRVFRLEISDAIDFGVAFLKKYHTASAIPDNFDPAELPSDQWTVTDPLMDGETHEGEYRHVKLRVFRQMDSGKEHFLIVQTLAKGFESSATREYDFSVSDPSLPVPDTTGLKFYDSGVEFGGLPVYYSNGDAYALWTHATIGLVVSVVGEVGQDPNDYFLESGGTYTGTGDWEGSFTLDAISETVADLSRFRVVVGDYYHANHSMPTLRLENVSPGAAHDLCEYLNQDTFTDIEYFDGTLPGTWYRIHVRTEAQDDGSHHILLFLTDTANVDSYVRFKAGPNEWKGLYHKWDASEATIAELESTIQFNSTGEIVESGGGTLQDLVIGRSVSWSRINRNNTSRLFELVVEIIWLEAAVNDTESTPHGRYNQSTWVVQHFGAEDWPNAAAIASEYDDGSHYDDTGNDSEASDPDDLWHQTTTDKYYICIQTSTTELFTNSAFFTETKIGLWRIDRTLGGPSLGGLPRLNNADNGTYDYSIMSTKTEVVDGGWHIFGAPNFKTNRTTLKAHSGVQPIRLRLGGQKAYETDARGNLIGVDWNLEWDSGNANGNTYPNDMAPDNWVTHGYQSRYGDWQPHWKKGFAVGENSLRSPSHSGAICHGPFYDDTLYQLGDIAHFDDIAGDTPPAALVAGFYELQSADAWVIGGSYATDDVHQSADKIYTCIAGGTSYPGDYAPGTVLAEPYWKLGAQNAGTWELVDNDLVVSKIAIEGVGVEPFEQTDDHIAIMQELQEEVEWDLDWEYSDETSYSIQSNFTDTTDTAKIPVLGNLWHQTATDIYYECTVADGGSQSLADTDYFRVLSPSAVALVVFFLADGLRYQATGAGGEPVTGESPSDVPTKWTESLANPTDWDAGSMLARHGDWRAAWTKGYAYGSGSLRIGNGAICKGPYSASALYKFGDVAAKGTTRETPQFEYVSGATAWVISGSYATGDVRQSDGQVYRCIAGGTSYPGDFAPGTAAAEPYWSAGAPGGNADLAWKDFDEDDVVSKIGTLGVGVEPFETFVTVGVLNEDGTNAYSTSARYSFFSNYALNPKIQEESRCVMQRQQTLELITYFAVNPHWLADLGGRMPTSWADLDAIQSDAEDGTDGVLTIDYNENNSNFELEHRIEPIDRGMDVWAIRKTIVLNSEVEDDTTAAQEILNRLIGASTGSRIGGVVVVKHDRTGMGGDAWDGTYLDLS